MVVAESVQAGEAIRDDGTRREIVMAGARVASPVVMLEQSCSEHQCVEARVAIGDFETRQILSARLADEVLASLFRSRFAEQARWFKQRCEYPDMAPFPIDLMHPVAKAMLVWELRFEGKTAFERWLEAAAPRLLECPARREWIEAERKSHFAIWRVTARAPEHFSLQSIADGRDVALLHEDCRGEQFELGDLVFARVLELGGRHVFGDFAGEAVTGKDAREVLRALIAAPAGKRADPEVAFEAFYVDALPGESSFEIEEEEAEADGAA